MHKYCNVVLDLPEELILEIASVLPGRKRGGAAYKNLLATSGSSDNDIFMYPCAIESRTDDWYVYNGTEFTKITSTEGRSMLKRWR